MRALAAVVLCACSGTTGTLVVDLKTAPDSHVLDAVDRLRLTLTDPHQVVESGRTGSGFNLTLEVDAGNETGALLVEGLDASGTLVACGQSPAFSVGAISAEVAIYMAAPRSIGLAPLGLTTALSEVGVASLGYGVAIVGGRDSSGAPSNAAAIYNAYDHSLTDALPLPAPRAGLALATGSGGGVYLFGGTGIDGKPTGTLWRFDSTAAPKGGYVTVGDTPQFARAGQLMVPIGIERFLITGTPALTLDTGTLSARSDVAALPPAGAAMNLPDGTPSAMFADDPMVLFRNAAFEPLPASARSDASAAGLTDGRAVVIGGLDPAPSRDALVVDPVTGSVAVVADAIATPRSHPSLAATSRYLIVAGGTDAAGVPIGSAEVLDATTLAPVVTLPLVARSGMFAIALSNDQILLGGGSPASTQLELFTPDPSP